MTTSSQHRSDLFVRAFASAAILGPILLVAIAGTLPEGLARGQLIVSGHCAIVAILAIALVLRSAYGLGFSKAIELTASKPNHSMTT